VVPIMDSIPSRSVPVVTRALILINVVVFFFELALPQEALEQVFYLFGGGGDAFDDTTGIDGPDGGCVGRDRRRAGRVPVVVSDGSPGGVVSAIISAVFL
jgi:hypothetical protein